MKLLKSGIKRFPKIRRKKKAFRIVRNAFFQLSDLQPYGNILDSKVTVWVIMYAGKKSK